MPTVLILAVLVIAIALARFGRSAPRTDHSARRKRAGVFGLFHLPRFCRSAGA
jgi:hypothetical protein